MSCIPPWRIPANLVSVVSDTMAQPSPFHMAGPSSQPAAGQPSAPQIDDPFDFLRSFDTVFLIDDSSSMYGNSWEEVAAALGSITPICTARDADGIDIYFLNKPDEQRFRQITSPEAVKHIFSQLTPGGLTPTGARLNHILKPYLQDYKKQGDKLKPLNIIVITDGQPTDNPESVIIEAARKLDDMEAPPWQVGIQFFQVGKDRGAAKALQQLDDDLIQRGGGIRDMVDTVPWSGIKGGELNAEAILKVVLGAVNRRIDRKAAVPNESG